MRTMPMPATTGSNAFNAPPPPPPPARMGKHHENHAHARHHGEHCLQRATPAAPARADGGYRCQFNRLFGRNLPMQTSRTVN